MPNAYNLPGFINCPQVCELLAKNAWQQVAEMKQTATPADPVGLPTRHLGLQLRLPAANWHLNLPRLKMHVAAAR